MSLISFRQHVAKKDYPCAACEHYLLCIDNGSEHGDRPEYQAVVEAARADGWMVRKGQKYNRYVALQDGDFVSVAQRIDMTDLLTDLRWWDD